MFKADFIIRGMCCNEGSTFRKVREKRDYLVENDPDSWFCKVLIMLAQFDFSRLDRDQYVSTADWLWGEVSEKKWIRRSKWKPQTKLDIHRSAVWTWNKILPDHSLCAFALFPLFLFPFLLSLSSFSPLCHMLLLEQYFHLQMRHFQENVEFLKYNKLICNQWMHTSTGQLWMVLTFHWCEWLHAGARVFVGSGRTRISNKIKKDSPWTVWSAKMRQRPWDLSD